MKSTVKFRIGVSSFFKILIIIFSTACTIPLLFILFYILKEGITKVNWHLFTDIPKPVGEEGGGVLNAILGSVIIVALAAIIAIPIGILCGVYLAENPKKKLAYYSRLCVDVLQGMPSIVTGIVIYGWIVKEWGYSAWSGSIALAIMMLPIVIRSTEETLKLLPNILKEAGLALGMPYNKVVMKVLIPCGFSGILSGIMLSIARITGETAPLIFTAFGASFVNTDVRRPMEALPTLIFKYATSPYDNWHDLAWGASVILLVWVLALNITTKIITRKWQVQL